MKKVFALILAALMVLSLAACNKPTPTPAPQSSQAPQTQPGGETDPAKPSEDPTPAIEKPTEISVIVNGTWPDAATGALDAFVKKQEELTGIKIKLTKPDHSSYDDVLGQVIASGEWPDVIYTCEPYYSSWAQQGVFWDMTEAFEASDLYQRAVEAGSISSFKSEYLNGHMYGLPVKRGNGAVTYIKKAWLDAVGLDVPTNWEEYLAVLEAFSTKDPDGNGIDGDTYGVSASKFIQTEPPYIMYLPEVWQDAYPYFVQKEDGTWVDGFLEDNCKEALERMNYIYEKGYLDPDTLNNATSNCRDKFYDNGPGSFGVFTYWACNWAYKLKLGLEEKGVDSELIACEPIKEVKDAGGYIDRVSYVWCISSKAKNPEGIFEYYVSKILDGGEMQFLWTWGPEESYWSTKAETVQGVEYKEGEFHMLENPDNHTLYVNAHIDPTGQLVPITNSIIPDPSATVISKEAYDCMLMFNENSRGASITPPTDAGAEYNGEIVSKKNELIAKIAMGEYTLEEAYAEYKDGGYEDHAAEIVEQLNALGK
ncbi:MAG: extracellular solute-binding protein [Lachnospiraceae bacterium]|nr:extracellular solute-binding protein [Lachnospiraceae bacterium]